MLAMTSPIQAPFSEGSPAGTDTEAVINEIIADFSFLCSILAEAESCEGYPVVSRFGDLDSAVDFLDFSIWKLYRKGLNVNITLTL